MTERVAWTGGQWPARPSETPRAELRLARAMFRADVAEWRRYWGAPLPWDVARIFWRRGRADAYATMRDRERAKG